MIAVVWVLSALISIPPLIGWNDWTATDLSSTCELTTKKGFVIFSATLSFYAPLLVMTIVYCKIFLAARERLRQNRAKSGVARLSTARAKNATATEKSLMVETTHCTTKHDREIIVHPPAEETEKHADLALTKSALSNQEEEENGDVEGRRRNKHDSFR